MDKISDFLLKLTENYVFYTSLAAISSFANINGPVTFCYVTYNANFFFK